jgi:hypothetical protein
MLGGSSQLFISYLAAPVGLALGFEFKRFDDAVKLIEVGLE